MNNMQTHRHDMSFHGECMSDAALSLPNTPLIALTMSRVDCSNPCNEETRSHPLPAQLDRARRARYLIAAFTRVSMMSSSKS